MSNKFNSAIHRGLAGLGLLAILLTGCGGGGAPAPRGAGAEIKAARSALEEGRYAESQNRYDEAQSKYEEARKKIASGKGNAAGTDKGKLEEISEEVNSALAGLDSKRQAFLNKEKIRKEKEDQEKQLAALNKKTGEAKTSKGPTAEEIAKAEAKKKEDDEKARLAQEEVRKKAMAAANTQADPAKKTVEEDPDDGPKVAAKTGEGGEAGEAKAAPKGPYRAYGENPPNISVDAVNAKGEYMFCYVQLFNKSDTDKRIGRVEGTFKDAGNGKIDDAIGTFQFDFFARDIADPTDQNNAKAPLTGGSHTIPAHGSMMLVLVGKNRNAAKAKKCSVTANYEDGSSASDSGPGSVLQEAEKPIPGLK